MPDATEDTTASEPARAPQTPGQAAYLAWHRTRFPGTLPRIVAAGWDRFDDNGRDSWEAGAQAAREWTP